MMRRSLQTVQELEASTIHRFIATGVQLFPERLQLLGVVFAAFTERNLTISIILTVRRIATSNAVLRNLHKKTAMFLLINL